MSVPGSANAITYEIIVEARAAVKALSDLQKSGADVDATMALMQEQVQAIADKMGVSWEMVLSIMKQVNTEMMKATNNKVSVLGGVADPKMVDDFKRAIDSLFSGARSGLAGANEEGTSFFNTLNMIKMALGFLESYLLFQLLQAFQQVFSEAIKGAHDYYMALQNIQVAQDSMAKGGINVTNQNLLDMVDKLHQKWTMFSQVDMTQAVSQASLLSIQYGLSVDQVQKLVEMATTLAALHGGMPADYVDNLLKAAQGTNALWANQMGINVTTQEILDKAKEMNLVDQNAKSITDERVKVLAGLAIEQDRLDNQSKIALENQGKGINAAATLTATWKDETAKLGQAFMIILAPLEQILTFLLKMRQAYDAAEMPKWLDAWAHMVAYAAMYITILGDINQALHGNFEGLRSISQQWDEILAKAEKNANAMMNGGLDLTGNTPVGPAPQGSATPAPTPTNSQLDSIFKDYQSYYDSMVKAREDFNNKMQNLQDQYQLRVQQEEENTALHIQEEQQNYHLKVLQEEQNFQQKMKELQNQYLLDLEDALRKRDAEAVIKIIEKYNNEKTTAQQQENLKLEQMKQDEQLRIKQMKEEEALRLQQMKEEYALQQKEAQQAYALQQADLARALDAKLQEEAVNIGQEYGLNSTGIQKLYDLFKQYYGAGGSFASVQNQSYVQMVNQSQTFVTQMEAIMAQYAAVMSAALSGGSFAGVGEGQYGGYGSPTPPATGGGANTRRRATGGLSLASSATTATYGEAGPELAMFLPLNASRNAQQTAFASDARGLGAGFGGQATILLQVSGDMEARIISNTLNQAALAIDKVYRSRQS